MVTEAVGGVNTKKGGAGVVKCAGFNVPNQRLVCAVRFHQGGDQLEANLRFRLRPTQRTEQVIGDDDLIEIRWSGGAGWGNFQCERRVRRDQ